MNRAGPIGYDARKPNLAIANVQLDCRWRCIAAGGSGGVCQHRRGYGSHDGTQGIRTKHAGR